MNCCISIAKKAQNWASPVYGYGCFATVELRCEGNQYYHWFKCLQQPCKSASQGGVCHYLHKQDASLAKSLASHIKTCKPGLLEGIEQGSTLMPNRAAYKDGSLVEAFRHHNGAKETYCHDLFPQR